MGPRRKPYGTIAVGVVLTCVGLALAVLSEPSRFSLDPKYDLQILLRAAFGFVTTILGVVMLLTVASSTTQSMPPYQKTRANTGVGLGFVLQLAGFFLSQSGDAVDVIGGAVLILLSMPVFIWGCMNYAAGKGRSKWFGIVGLLGIVGLVVLIVLPDQHEVAS